MKMTETPLESVVSGDVAVVSVTTRNYLYRARVLFESVAEYLPEAKRIAVCADSLDGVCDTSKESFEIVEARSLGIPRFEQLAIALGPTGLCCVLKPYSVDRAFAKPGVEHVIYIDTDVGLYRRPEEVLRALGKASFVLTPHHLRPLPAGAIPNEQTLAAYGAFNAGIFGVRKSEEAQDFLHWWRTWMLDPRRLESGTGYDQVWLNYVPAYCPATEIMRDRTYNVAFWNLWERELNVTSEGVFQCGGEPLTAFHFSNFSEEHSEELVWPRIFSNHEKTEAIERVVSDMVDKWKGAGREECLRWGYGFSVWPDGTKIQEDERDAAASQWDSLPLKADPWSKIPGPDEVKLHTLVKRRPNEGPAESVKSRIRKMLDTSPLDIMRKFKALQVSRKMISGDNSRYV